MHRNSLVGRLHAQARALCTECCSVVQLSGGRRLTTSRNLPLQGSFSTNGQGRSTTISRLIGPGRFFHQRAPSWRAFSTTTITATLDPATTGSPTALPLSSSISERDGDDDRADDLDDLDILASGKLPPAPPAIQELRDQYIATKESDDPRQKQALLNMYHAVVQDPDLLAQLYPVDFVQALYAAKSLHSLPSMRGIIDDVDETVHRRHPSFYHVMMKAYMGRNDIVQSGRIWELMKQRKVELNQISYHIMLRHCKARRSSAQALKLLDEMKRTGIPVSEYTYVLLLGVCFRQPNTHLAQQLFDEIPTQGLEWTAYHYSTLLATYAKAGDRAGAFRVFDEMQEHGFVPNPIIYNSLLSVVKDRTEQENLYNEFLEQGFQPNVRTLLTLRIHLAEILERMNEEDPLTGAKKMDATREDFNVLLTFALKASKTGVISKVLEMMKARSFQPDAFTFSTLMDAFVKIGQHEQARMIFEEVMASDEIVPDVVVYTNAISAALGQSDTMGALQILKRMLDDGLMPNAVTMNQLLTTMVRGGASHDTSDPHHHQPKQPRLAITTSTNGIEMAELVVELMRQNGIREDIRSFNILLSAYVRANEPEKMMHTFHRMAKARVWPDLVTYETLILGHLRSGNLRYAMDTYFTMRERKLYGHSAIHNQLLSALVASGQTQQVLQLWRDLSYSNRVRDDQSFKIMLDACDRFGLLEQRHDIELEYENWKLDCSAFENRDDQVLA